MKKHHAVLATQLLMFVIGTFALAAGADTAAAARRLPPRAPSPSGPGVVGDVFNLDPSGLPQDEETVAVCPSDPQVVLGGTNDFRHVLEPGGGIVGWHLSRDGGANLSNEGILP